MRFFKNNLLIQIWIFYVIDFFLSYDINMNTSLRVYETDTPQHKLYSDIHRNQTLDYVLDKEENIHH